MTEAYASLPNTLRYYGNVENGKLTKYGSQIPFNFELISKTNFSSKASDFKTNIENWLKGMPKAKEVQANWVVRFYGNLYFFTDHILMKNFISDGQS